MEPMSIWTEKQDILGMRQCDGYEASTGFCVSRSVSGFPWKLFLYLGTAVFVVFSAIHTKINVKLRKILQPGIKATVERGVKTVILIQSYRSQTLDFFFSFMAMSVSVEFYTTFLPLLFWAEHSKLARQLTILMALCIYFAGAVKDCVCAPRPACPPVWRRGSDMAHAAEYGFPSSHTANAIALTLYLVTHALDENVFSGSDSLLWWTVGTAVFVCASVVLSRLYLGMHTVVDLVGGIVLGVSVFSVWRVASAPVDSFILHNRFAGVFQCCISFLALLAYPTPESATPSFEDATAFDGVVLGVVMGWHRIATYHPKLKFSAFPLLSGGALLKLLVRAVIGLPVSLALKSFGKFLGILVLPSALHFLGIPYFSTKYVKQEPNLYLANTAKSCEKIPAISEYDGKSGGEYLSAFTIFGRRGNSEVKPSIFSPIDVDVGVRFVSFAFLGWGVVEPCALLFNLLHV